MAGLFRTATLRRWLNARHRRFWWIALPALAWSLTGLLHPVMSRWQPSAAAMAAPADLLAPPAGTHWADLPAPSRLLPAGQSLRELRALTWQGRAYWSLQTADGRLHYVDARDGRPADLEPALVTYLARHYTGETQAAVTLTRVSAFSSEYPFVNRYLPVWRVAFDRPDGLIAFIEPRSLRLAALTDDWKTSFSALFRNLHSWTWWSHEPSRDLAMTLALALVVFMALTGVARATSGAVGNRPPLRRWHRRLGLAVALATLAWCVSGIFHVLAMDKSRPGFATHPLKLDFLAGELTRSAPAEVPDGAMLQILATPGGPLWHWQQLMLPDEGEHHHGGHGAVPMLHEGYASARTGATATADALMRALVAEVAPGLRWQSARPVTRFTDEYGFVQKRLPVWQLVFDTPDHLAVYVDIADVAVAAAVRDLDRAEGFSFAYLHKVHWLDSLGKDVRDAVAGAFALMVFVLALLGLRLARRRD